MVRLLRPSQGKYTPVVADVLMDYILSKYWHQYHDESVEVFCRNTYITVYENLELIPERLHPRINRMLGHRWLESCKDKNRMQDTLVMLSKRVSFENNIPNALYPYEEYEVEMDKLFVQFFADMQRHINLRSGD
jgi:acyl carrier protein phosphodiesterase